MKRLTGPFAIVLAGVLPGFLFPISADAAYCRDCGSMEQFTDRPCRVCEPKSPKAGRTPDPTFRTPDNDSGAMLVYACGKEWWVGGNTVNWNQAHAWVTAQEGNWRMPTRAELKELSRKGSHEWVMMPFRVWTGEMDGDGKAWNVYLFDGTEVAFSLDLSCSLFMVVAVRDLRVSAEGKR